MRTAHLASGLLCLSLALVAATTAFAQDRPIVAVFDLEVKGTKLDKGTIDRLTDYLGSLLGSRGFRVVPRSQLRERLVEAKKGSYKDCFEQSCQIEIGKELAAQKSLASQVLKIGSKCKITLNLFDLKQSASDGSGTATGECTEDGVVVALEQAVAAMLGDGSLTGPAAGKEPAGPKAPDLGEYERLASQAQTEETKRLEAEKKAQAEKASYLTALDTAWMAVQKVAVSKSMTHLARAGVVRKFLQDFGRDNPHQAEAKGLLAKLDQGEEPDEAGATGIEWVASAPAGIEFSRTEITVAQYRACVEAGKCSTPRTKSEYKYCNWGYSDRDRHPVNCVDWNQATAFCAWAGGRLPSEDEWYAEASNKGSRQYAWGEEEVSCERAVMSQGGRGCGHDSTWPVCAKERGNSASGLCDMSGNVWEWTSSWDDNTEKARVVRGGSWYRDNTEHFLASYRNRSTPAGWDDSVGLRCVRPGDR